MSTSNKKRFRNRDLQFIDLVNQFESQPTSTHIHSALGVIERMEQDGSEFLGEDSKSLERWSRGCSTLHQFINSELHICRFVENQSLETVLRKFFNEFEHTTDRFYQMFHRTVDTPEYDHRLRNFVAWIDLVFRLTTYAIVSYWLHEESEKASTK